MLLLYTAIICNLLLVNQIAANDIKPDTSHEQDFEDYGLHYGKYLKEVVAALDKDQKFTETIKNMDSKDIASGKVAEQLKHVHEDVRKKLNELKYLEIKRLRDLATRKNEMETHGETYHGNDKRKWRTLGASLSELPEHVGSDSTFFDTKDLHKLMVAATNDLEKLDKERKEDFKTYEMEKEWQFRERLKSMNETEKNEAIKLRQQLKEKHENHDKVHEPGSKQQFEEVWEKKDNLPKAEFDPKTFFVLHDTNSDNHWDPQEVRQLLTVEIQKMYDPNNPEDDPNEMEEEFEKMREHVYKEIDADHDGLISMKEFLDYSKKDKFARDNSWNEVSKENPYSQHDYEEYVKHRDEQVQKMRYYDPSLYANQPANLHLPSWGHYGMPAGVHPGQYYNYQVDPNHPQAQQMLAHQQMAYQQPGYQQPVHQQPGIVPQHASYQQPNQQYYQQQQPPIQPNIQQPAQVAAQPNQQYQQPAQVQHNNQYQQPAQAQTNNQFQQPQAQSNNQYQQPAQAQPNNQFQQPQAPAQPNNQYQQQAPVQPNNQQPQQQNSQPQTHV